MKQSKRKTSKLSEPIHQQLNLYALAAGAAGASLLAVSQPLEAEVVFTPTYARLTNGQIAIDLNHDGIVDFTLTDKGSGSACCFYTRTLSVDGAFVGSSQNGVIGVAGFANAIKAGQAIGPRQLFLFAPMIMATAFNDSNSFFFVHGAFANTTDRFLGFKFQFNGEQHYGWARFSSVKAGFNGVTTVVVAVLTGYAYETEANKAIIAGAIKAGAVKSESANLSAPSEALPASAAASLGMLALGAPGLEIWRRADQLATARKRTIYRGVSV